jgi:hypothetical protein
MSSLIWATSTEPLKGPKATALPPSRDQVRFQVPGSSTLPGSVGAAHGGGGGGAAAGAGALEGVGAGAGAGAGAGPGAAAACRRRPEPLAGAGAAAGAGAVLPPSPLAGAAAGAAAFFRHSAAHMGGASRKGCCAAMCSSGTGKGASLMLATSQVALLGCASVFCPASVQPHGTFLTPAGWKLKVRVHQTAAAGRGAAGARRGGPGGCGARPGREQGLPAPAHGRPPGRPPGAGLRTACRRRRPAARGQWGPRPPRNGGRRRRCPGAVRRFPRAARAPRRQLRAARAALRAAAAGELPPATACRPSHPQSASPAAPGPRWPQCCTACRPAAVRTRCATVQGDLQQ